MAYPRNHKVIDLSHWNEVTSWEVIKDEGILGVIHKYSQGTSYVDDKHDERREAAVKVGLLWGRYHFAEGSNVTTQVEHALTGYVQGDLFALDWEENSNNTGTMTLTQAESFVAQVNARIGHYPVIYSGNTMKEALGGKESPILNRCELWLAHYADQPVCPPGWSHPWLWQHTDQGVMPGVEGLVDLDAFYGSDRDLIESWCPARQPIAMPRPPSRPPMVSGATDTVTITVSIPAGSGMLIETTGSNRAVHVYERPKIS